MTDFFWQDVHDAVLRKYWMHKKTADVAAELTRRFNRQFTRNSVIGRAKRLGLQRKRQSDFIKIDKKYREMPPEAPQADGQGVPLLNAKDCHCRYMLPRAGHYVCGAPIVYQSWCEQHAKQMYGTGGS